MRRDKGILYTICVLVAFGLIGVVHAWRSASVTTHYSAERVATFGTAAASPITVDENTTAPAPAAEQTVAAPVHTGWRSRHEVRTYADTTASTATAPAAPAANSEDETPKLKRRQPQPPAEPEPQASTETAQTDPSPQPAPTRRYHRRDHSTSAPAAPQDTPSVVRERPRNTSIAIIAGSAAAGALIGGIAGHGKGAAIGALAGAAGGYVYDRYTKHKRVDPASPSTGATP